MKTSTACWHRNLTHKSNSHKNRKERNVHKNRKERNVRKNRKKWNARFTPWFCKDKTPVRYTNQSHRGGTYNDINNPFFNSGGLNFLLSLQKRPRRFASRFLWFRRRFPLFRRWICRCLPLFRQCCYQYGRKIPG